MNLKKVFAFLLIQIIIFNTLSINVCTASLEMPEQTYYGWSQANSIYKNLDFKDVEVLDDGHWAKPSIYEVAALDVIKGYGNKMFGNTDYLSKEQAIALIYRIVGLEGRAQQAGEELERARMEDDRLEDAVRIWSDGYLKLASQQGLISQDDFNDAMEQDQAFAQFKRTDFASREEIARWIVMALGIDATYPQQAIFNNYNDWEESDSLKIPYIETALQMGLMKGTDEGYFYPKKGITRQEMAQLLKNSLAYAFPLLNMHKSFGVIEEIENLHDYSVDGLVYTARFSLRMTDGKLHEIIATYADDARLNEDDKDFIVYKDGVIGKSKMLHKGDSFELITDQDGFVRFMRVTESSAEPDYIAARVKSIDAANRRITIEWLGITTKPSNTNIPNHIDETASGYGKTVVFTVSQNAGIVTGGQTVNLDELNLGEYVVLTVRGNIVSSIEGAVFDIDTDKSVSSGIVEENNPSLGYISLYSEDGTVKYDRFRVFYYDARKVEVLRDHIPTSINGISPGDTAFVKLDKDGNVFSISARNNYVPKYATIISKSSNNLNVEYDDGSQQIFVVNPDVLVVKDRRIVDYDNVQDGDRVKLILNEQDGVNGLKQLTIESSGQYISNIYRAKLNYIDDITGKLVWHEVERFDAGKWIKEDTKGSASIKIGKPCTILYEDKNIGIDVINKYLKDSGIYIAAETTQGGSEKAVFISIKNDSDRELVPLEDSIDAVYEGTRDISVSRNTNTFKYNDGTIIIKNGRLVRGSNIMPDDKAFIVANRSDSTRDLIAKVISIVDSKEDSLEIYRGRISDINDNTDFTVESYAIFDGLTWETTMAAKTFDISNNTRILGEDGPISIRDFIAYGDNSYKNTTVYIVVQDSEAVLLSIAPYATSGFTGEVLSVETDMNTNNVTGFTLFRAKAYDSAKKRWVNSSNVDITIPVNGMIFKNGRISSADNIRKGCQVRVVKVDKSLAGEAYLIFVEN